MIDALEERVLLSFGGLAAPAESASPIEVHALNSGGHRMARTNHQTPRLQPIQAQRLASLPNGLHAHATSNRWGWLADTYWYVPTPNVPAVLFETSSQTLAPLADQTVFHITGYRAGYFWGVTVAQLGSMSPVCSSLVGSVTPEGRVLLNFTQMNEDSGPTITEGFGQMRRKFGQWTMENQMFTDPSAPLQVGHWAYMVQTRPGLPSWNSLPAVGVSVEQFLSNCPGQGPQPIGS